MPRRVAAMSAGDARMRPADEALHPLRNARMAIDDRWSQVSDLCAARWPVPSSRQARPPVPRMARMSSSYEAYAPRRCRRERASAECDEDRSHAKHALPPERPLPVSLFNDLPCTEANASASRIRTGDCGFLSSDSALECRSARSMHPIHSCASAGASDARASSAATRASSASIRASRASTAPSSRARASAGSCPRSGIAGSPLSRCA